MVAIDTNVLIDAHRRETRWHQAAASELIRRTESGELFAIPVFCVSEFVRVVTHRRVFRPASPVAEAFGFLEEILSSPGCLVLCPGPRFTTLLRETVERADARGNLVFDAQIAALCREHGVSTIITRDQDFYRFEPLRVRLLDTAVSAKPREA